MKIRAILATVLAGLAIFQATEDWNRLANLLKKHTLDLKFYRGFGAEVQGWLVFFGLLLFLCTLFPFQAGAASGDQPGTAKPPLRGWLLAFLSVLICSSALVAYTNPEGRFPWKQREAYLSIEARPIKAALFKALTKDPELVTMGSSISFTIPADYIEQKWKVDTFNMSINDGSMDDFYYLLNFMVKQKRDPQLPGVVTIEILRRNLQPSSWHRMPASLIPYMEPDQALRGSFELLDHTISSTYISDSLFTLAYVDRGRWFSDVTFDESGTGIRTAKSLSYEEYKQNVEKGIRLKKGFLSCQQLDPAGSAYVKKIVELSQEYRFAVVFYVSPVNADFYKWAKLKPDSFQGCAQKMNAYMQGIADSYENIFYRDLGYYEPISRLGPQAFLDTHHLNRRGSEQLLDVLAPEIEAALQWWQDNRSEP